MIPRKRLDFSLYCALRFCLNLFTKTDTKARKKLQFLFSEDSRISLPFLSVRSALDATLTALALPPDTEVLVSAVTIPSMIHVIEEHGLIPVAVDIDKDTLAPLIDDAKKKITTNTKIFIFAHLFGSVSDLTPLAQFCQTNNIFLIEDCAQAFIGPEYVGHPASDAVLWSFGPLKTATALLGAMATFSGRHAALAEKINTVCAAWPVYSRYDYGIRIFKYSVLHIFSQPIVYSIFVNIFKLLNKDIDTFISKTTRSFPKDKLFSFIRTQPNTALIRSMAWRLSGYPLWQIESREKNGEERVAQLGLSTQVPGEKTIRRTFWLFPWCAPEAASSIVNFRANNIDASAASSSIVCISSNPAIETPQAHKLMQSIVYLPLDIAPHKNLEKNIAKILMQKQTNQQPSAHSYEQKEFNRVLVGYTTKHLKPATKEELVTIIQEHIKDNIPFTVVGKAKSHAGHTILHGASRIDTTGVQTIYKPNIERQEIKVEAGAIWRDVTRYLHTYGYSPLTTQSSNDFTVGGSVAGGIHGRSLHASHIADAVVAIEYIDRKTGAVAVATPTHPMFAYLVAGQGWFGVITEVTFKIVPNRLFSTTVKKIATTKIPTLLATLLQQPEEIFFMARPLIGLDYTFAKTVVYTWKEQPTTTTNMPLNDAEQNVQRDRIIFRISLLWHYFIVWRNQLEGWLGLGTHGRVYMRNALICPPVTPLAFLENTGNRREQVQEFFVPISRFDDLYQLLPELCKKYGVRVAGMTFRFVKKNNRALLSSSGNSDMIACMMYLSTPNKFGAMANLYAFIREATNMAIQLGGVPYLAYAFQQNPKQLLQAYPALQELAQTTPAQSRFLTRLKSYLNNKQ